jgi:hypothetical protein
MLPRLMSRSTDYKETANSSYNLRLPGILRLPKLNQCQRFALSCNGLKPIELSTTVTDA